jgi:hypothetical protein
MNINQIKALIQGADLPENMEAGRYLPETFDVFAGERPIARFFDPTGRSRAELFAKLPVILPKLLADLDQAQREAAQWRALAEEKCDEEATAKAIASVV